MKNIPYYFAIILFSALLVACPDLTNKHFKDGETKLMTDEQGNRYMVRHVNGSEYEVKPLDPVPSEAPTTAPNPSSVSPQPTTPQPPQIDPKWR